MSVMVEKLVGMGFSFICANCTKLHIGVERGEKHCGYSLKGRDCGGPISGLVFPQYEGALTRSIIASVCFRCGDESTDLIEVKGKGFVGACEEHLKMLKTMAPVIPSKGNA